MDSARPSSSAVCSRSVGDECDNIPLSQGVAACARTRSTYCHVVPAGDAQRNRQKRRRVLAHRRLLRSGLLLNRGLPLSWGRLPQEYIDGLKASYPGRSYYGPPEYECAHCSAVFWFHERSKRHSSVRGQSPARC